MTSFKAILAVAFLAFAGGQSTGQRIPSFDRAVALENKAETSANASLGDLDGDGSPNIVAARSDAPNMLYLNSLAMLGSAAGHQDQPTGRSVVVSVVSAEEIYVGKDRIAATVVADEVAKRLQALSVEDRVVYIKSAPDVAYGPVVRLIDALRARGITRIGLIAAKPDREAGPHDATPGAPDEGSAPGSPHDDDAAAMRDSVIVEVSVDRRGRVSYALEGRKVAARQLTAALGERLSRAATKTVIILAPKSMSYKEVVRVIDCAKKAGAANIGLQEKFAP